jgi:hypothetical protein
VTATSAPAGRSAHRDESGEPGERRPRAAFDLSAAFAVGFVGNAAGAGGEVGGRLALGRRAWLVAGASAMFGDMEVAQATTRTLRASGGLAWLVMLEGPTLPFSLGLALRAGAARHALAREAVGLATIRAARWIGVGELRAELGWWFASHTALVATLGVEVAWGATRVMVDHRVAETIPMLRGVAGLGVRTNF